MYPTIRVDKATGLGRIDHYVSMPHIRDLNRTATEAFEHELGRVLGKDQAQQFIAERDARLERERNPRRDRRKQFGKLRIVANIMHLLNVGLKVHVD